MESLKTAGESAVNSATGTLLFIWSKVSNVLPKRTSDFTFKLDAGKSKATSLSVTLVRPANESEFVEVTHLFIMTIVALGVASYTIVGKFIDDVIFGTGLRCAMGYFRGGVANGALRRLLVGLLRGNAYAGGAQAAPVLGLAPRLLSTQIPQRTY